MSPFGRRYQIHGLSHDLARGVTVLENQTDGYGDKSKASPGSKVIVFA